jgi:hypothetical protein
MEKFKSRIITQNSTLNAAKTASVIQHNSFNKEFYSKNPDMSAVEENGPQFQKLRC